MTEPASNWFVPDTNFELWPLSPVGLYPRKAAPLAQQGGFLPVGWDLIREKASCWIVVRHQLDVTVYVVELT